MQDKIMEQLENFMVMPEYKYKSEYIPDDVWSEMEDRAWEDIE